MWKEFMHYSGNIHDIMVQYSTVQYSTVQYRIQHSSTQYSVYNDINILESSEGLWCGQVCVVDVDRAADVQALREQGFEACYVALTPHSSHSMLENIHAALADKPLPGYEPEDAACLLLQVTWAVSCHVDYDV